MEDIKRVVAIGFFDGIHIGHAALMNKTLRRAEELGAIPSVLSFDVHPDNLVFGREVPLLNSTAGREDIIKRLFGIDSVVFIHFNQHLMRMSWKDFIDRIVDELNVGWIVVGHDFCFGYKGEGTTEKLKEYCAARSIGCDVIPAVTLDGVVVSSTYIRGLIAEGKMEEAARFLGHPHVLSDTVRPGYHLGRTIGAPTINTYFPDKVLIPRHGVYVTKVCLDDGSEYAAVTNVGVRPTFANGDKVSVESHLLDFSGDLYGRQVRVEFYSFLRDEVKFDSFEALSEQIVKDAQCAREYFIT